MARFPRAPAFVSRGHARRTSSSLPAAPPQAALVQGGNIGALATLGGGERLPAEASRILQWRISHQIEGLEELWALVEAELPHFDEGHAVACLSRAADLGYRRARGARGAALPEPVVALHGALCPLLEAGALQPASVARLAGAAARSLAAPPRLVSALADESKRHAAAWTAVDAALLARSFAQLRLSEPIAKLVEGASGRESGFGTQALVNVVWAAATTRVAFSNSLAALVDEASSRGDSLKPQGIANLVWSLGKLKQRRESAMEALLPYVAHRANSLTPQGIANTLWGLAALRPPGRQVRWLEEDAAIRLSLAAMRRVGDFNGPELTAVARFVASFGGGLGVKRKDELVPLLDAVACEAVRKLDILEPRNVAGLLWALARQRCEDLHAPSLLAEDARRRADEFSAEEVGSVTWAVSTLRLQNEPLLTTLAERLHQLDAANVGGGVPFRVLSSLMWAHAVVRVPDSPSFKPLAVAASERASEGSQQEIANLTWAVVLLGSPDAKLLDALAREAETRGGFSSQECANAAWAFATARFNAAPLFDALSRDFLACAARPLLASGLGRDWVGMVDALHRSGVTANMGSGTPRYELLAAFESAVFEPVARHLGAVMLRDGGARALRTLEKFASSLDLGSLGTTHTQRWLLQSSLAPTEEESDGAWAATAHECLKQARQGFGNSAVNRPPHQRDVTAWVACDVVVRVGELEERVHEPGRLATFDPAAKRRSDGDLHPLHIEHSRAGHAERVAMVGVLDALRTAESRLRRKVLRREGQDDVADWKPVATEALRPAVDISGHIHLLASHTPCLSCLAVAAQLARQLPHVAVRLWFSDARLAAAGAPCGRGESGDLSSI